MHAFILDTNFFINLQRPLNLGSKKEQVMENFIKLASPLITQQLVRFYTTPGSLKELEGFFEPITPVKELQKVIVVASPSISDLKIRARLFQDLVGEINLRLYKGLRAAEEPLKSLLTQAEKKPVNPETIKAQIKDLRSKYRRATRDGFLDSVVDFDLILLAKEKESSLVTSDQGLLSWSRRFGAQEILPEILVKKLQELSKTS